MSLWERPEVQEVLPARLKPQSEASDREVMSIRKIEAHVRAKQMEAHVRFGSVDSLRPRSRSRRTAPAEPPAYSEVLEAGCGRAAIPARRYVDGAIAMAASSELGAPHP